MFLCNAIARCCAPSSSIRLQKRSSVVSAYDVRLQEKNDKWVENITHCVFFQSISQILCTFVADSIVVKNQRFERLHWIRKVKIVIYKWRIWLTVFFFSASAKYCAPSAPISCHVKFTVVSPCVERLWWIRNRLLENLGYRITL